MSDDIEKILNGEPLSADEDTEDDVPTCSECGAPLWVTSTMSFVIGDTVWFTTCDTSGTKIFLVAIITDVLSPNRVNLACFRRDGSPVAAGIKDSPYGDAPGCWRAIDNEEHEFLMGLDGYGLKDTP